MRAVAIRIIFVYNEREESIRFGGFAVNQKRNTPASAIAPGGVMAALAVVIMSLGGLIPVATYVSPMLCALLLRRGKPRPELSCAEEARRLADRLTDRQLAGLESVLRQYAGECDYNVGVGHVLGGLAAKWEELL